MIPLYEKKRQLGILLLAVALLSLLALLVACSVGSANIGVWNSIRIFLGGIPFLGSGLNREGEEAAYRIILFQVRLPRAILSFMVGGALAVSGSILQGMFKNPMADPHVLGVSSGAGLGAAIAIIMGLHNEVLGVGAISLFAFAGGILTVFFVYSLARSSGRMTTAGLLLSGIAVSSLITALISGLMIINRNKIEEVVLWTMGSFAASGWVQVAWGAPLMLIGVLLSYIYARDLNILLLGDEEARHLGVEIGRVKRNLLTITSLTTASAVAVSGIIGFVGLMIPHIVRMLLGPDHRVLMPFSFFIGGIFLMMMDTLARTVISPLEVPVGILTALFGGPFFLYLLRKRGM